MRDAAAAFLLAGVLAAAAPRAVAAPDDNAPVESDEPKAPPPPEPSQAERLAAAVRAAESATRGAARDAAVAELAKFGWKELVGVVAEGGDRADVALDALARADDARLRELLVAAADPAADPLVRIVALRTVPRTRSGAGAADVLAVALALPEDHRRNPVFAELVRSALAAVLSRSPGEIGSVCGAWRKLDDALRAACLDASERAGTRAVSALLGARPRGDGEILARLARMPVRSAAPYAPGTLETADAALSDPDPETRRAAAYLAGRTGGIATARRLVEMLSDAASGDAAHAALERLAGTTLVRDAELWRVRLADENAWFQSVWPGEADALERGTPDEAAAVLVRIASRRLHAEALREPVEALAWHAEPKVRRAAADTLGRLGRPASIPVLERALDDLDTAVVASASRALADVTGLPAPAAAADWRKILER